MSLTDHPAADAQQLLEQGRLAAGQVERNPVDRGGTGGDVEQQPAAGADGPVTPSRTAQHGAQARLELGQGEGLDDVVVGAGVQARARGPRARRGRSRPGSAARPRRVLQGGEDLHAVEVGQAEVEDERVVRGRVQRPRSPPRRARPRRPRSRAAPGDRRSSGAASDGLRAAGFARGVPFGGVPPGRIQHDEADRSLTAAQPFARTAGGGHAVSVPSGFPPMLPPASLAAGHPIGRRAFLARATGPDRRHRILAKDKESCMAIMIARWFNILGHEEGVDSTGKSCSGETRAAARTTRRRYSRW